MGRVLKKADVLNFGKAFLLGGFFMTWLVAEQFQAERQGVLNVAAGGHGFQLETSGGKVRASGTFSFVSGIVYSYCFAVAFVIYGFIEKGSLPKWMIYLGTGAILLAMVTAGSGQLLLNVFKLLHALYFLHTCA